MPFGLHTLSCFIGLILAAYTAGAFAEAPAGSVPLGEVTSTVGLITFHSCTLESQQRRRDVECAYYSVPENYDEPDGTQVSLFIVRVPARDPDPAAAAFVPIAGGPGQAASEAFLFLDQVFADVTRERDVYLIDQRGTGRSNPQYCELAMDEAMLVAPAAEQLRASARECLATFDGDPAYYTTSVAVQDLAHLQRALDLEPWNLFGVSYGTRVAQHFVRRFPESVRTLTLDSVLPAPVTLGPDIALHSQHALEAFLQRCADTPDCNSAFPDLAQGLNRLLSELADRSRIVTFEDVRTGAPRDMTFTRAHLVGLLRLALYSAEGVSTLPPMLHQAYENANFAPLVRNATLLADEVDQTLAMGMHNAVVCTEDVPFYQYDAETAAAIAETYMGDLVLSGLEATCSVWPQGVIDENFKAPLETGVPVLMLSGELDPITPPGYGNAVLPGLANGRHLIVPGQSHTASVHGCVPTLVAQFIEQANTDHLQVECMNRLNAAPLMLNFNGPSP